VAHAAQRLKEAEKLGFKSAVMPKGSQDVSEASRKNSAEIADLPDLVARIAGGKLLTRERDDDEF
jgi:DNA repair protein RadA/Sms